MSQDNLQFPHRIGPSTTYKNMETMQNDNNDSHKQGDSQSRRSRNGQRRRNNSNQRSEGSKTNGRQAGGGRRDGQNQRSNRGKGAKNSSRRPMPAPIELNWWQKILKAVGLLKDPVRPPRPERRPDRSKGPIQQGDSPRKPRGKGPNSDQEDSGASTREPRARKKARGDRERKRPRGGDPSTVENRRIYIGNLSYETTESDIEELFKGIGPVRRVEIVYNRSTHRSKGYGFIEMLDVDEAKRTVEVLHDQYFMGRQLTVSGAKSKDHADAERDDAKNIAENNEMPPLAPLDPAGDKKIPEETAALPITDEITEPLVQTEVMQDNPEVPTEEFTAPPEETKELEENK